MSSLLAKNCIYMGDLCSYCLVCYEYLPGDAEVLQHILKTKHIENMLAFGRDFEPYKDDLIKKVRTIYFCLVCNATFSTAAEVSLHVQEPTHLDARRRHFRYVGTSVVFQNEVMLNEDAWNGFIDDVTCVICNVEFKYSLGHRLSSSHNMNVVKHKIVIDEDNNIYRKVNIGYHCLTCNKLIPDNTIKEHLQLEQHKQSFVKYDLATSIPRNIAYAIASGSGENVPSVFDQNFQGGADGNEVSETSGYEQTVTNKLSPSAEGTLSTHAETSGKAVSETSENQPLAETNKSAGTKDNTAIQARSHALSNISICNTEDNTSGKSTHGREVLDESSKNVPHAVTNEPSASNDGNTSAQDEAAGDESLDTSENSQQADLSFLDAIAFIEMPSPSTEGNTSAQSEGDEVENLATSETVTETTNNPSTSTEGSTSGQAGVAGNASTETSEPKPGPSKRPTKAERKKEGYKRAAPVDSLSVLINENSLYILVDKKRIYCNACVLEIPHLPNCVREHIEGKKHRFNVASSVSKAAPTKEKMKEFIKNHKIVRKANDEDMEFIVIDERTCIKMDHYLAKPKLDENGEVKCYFCKKPDENDEEHGVCEEHETLMKDSVYVTAGGLDREFIREVLTELLHCGYCGIFVEGYEDMLDHVETTDHKLIKVQCLLSIPKLKDPRNAVPRVTLNIPPSTP